MNILLDQSRFTEQIEAGIAVNNSKQELQQLSYYSQVIDR